jgi:hypothetical protein
MKSAGSGKYGFEEYAPLESQKKNALEMEQ